MAVAFAAAMLVSCQCDRQPQSAGSTQVPAQPPGQPQAKSPAPSIEQLIERGQKVYYTNCISCHNFNPHRPGSIGPELFGASRELLEARVIHGTYPEGYTPKRQTKSMVALPHLKNDIDALAAFLAQK